MTDVDGVPTKAEIQSGPTTDRSGTWIAKYTSHGAETCREISTEEAREANARRQAETLSLVGVGSNGRAQRVECSRCAPVRDEDGLTPEQRGARGTLGSTPPSTPVCFFAQPMSKDWIAQAVTCRACPG